MVHCVCDFVVVPIQCQPDSDLLSPVLRDWSQGGHGQAGWQGGRRTGNGGQNNNGHGKQEKGEQAKKPSK